MLFLELFPAFVLIVSLFAGIGLFMADHQARRRAVVAEATVGPEHSRATRRPRT
jgi:hypothetical protein